MNRESPLFKSQLSRLYQFNEFFQGLYSDLFSNPEESCIKQIQQSVFELVTINPIQTSLERQRMAQERYASMRSQSLLTDLVPFPQTSKFKTKKKRIKFITSEDKTEPSKDRTEEVKAYFLANPPVTGLRPVSHKIN